MTRDKIVQEKYSAIFNSAVSDKNRRIAELKTPQKLPAIRYREWNPDLPCQNHPGNKTGKYSQYLDIQRLSISDRGSVHGAGGNRQTDWLTDYCALTKPDNIHTSLSGWASVMEGLSMALVPAVVIDRQTDWVITAP